MGLTKRSIGRCALPAPFPPKGEEEATGYARCQNTRKKKNQTPARLNGSVASVAASSCKAQPFTSLRVAHAPALQARRLLLSGNYRLAGKRGFWSRMGGEAAVQTDILGVRPCKKDMGYTHG